MVWGRSWARRKRALTTQKSCACMEVNSLDGEFKETRKKKKKKKKKRIHFICLFLFFILVLYAREINSIQSIVTSLGAIASNIKITLVTIYS